MNHVHMQVRKILHHALQNPCTLGNRWNELKQGLFNLDRAIADFSSVHEVNLLGDSVGNSHVFFLLNNALPEALQELNRHILLSPDDTSSHALTLTELQHQNYCEVLQHFTFSTRTALDLIDQLVAPIF